MKKKYQYKYLTDEMKAILDKRVQEIGRDALYETIERNIEIEELARLQNEPDAFKNVHRGIWTTVQYLLKWYHTPRVLDLDNLEQEMLHYIDKERFFGWK